MAVTTYSSLFNTNPFFDDADALIVDDVHAAENYISDLWSLRVSASTPRHSSLHAALLGAIKPVLDSNDPARLSRRSERVGDLGWVDKVPTLDFVDIATVIISVAYLMNTQTTPVSAIRG